MKENITKFDLEDAFKALDELEVPTPQKGIKANRLNLQETLSKKPQTESLLEEYYDISDPKELNNAKEERDAEVAKAKLARIEKIVDLNAESPEDLLPSYVGKVIVQCPQCLTLFYKDEADIVPSEGDESIVNVSEVCQHCGNDSGYTLIGKVANIEPEEGAKFGVEEKEAETGEEEVEIKAEEETTEEAPTEENEAEEAAAEEEEIDLDALTKAALEGEGEETEEEPKEESFTKTSGTSTLTETATNLSDEAAEIANTDNNDSNVLTEASDLDTLLDSQNYKTKISDASISSYLDQVKQRRPAQEELDITIDDVDEESFDECLSKALTRIYQNVSNFKLTECRFDSQTNQLILEGIVTFKSGKTRQGIYTFDKAILKENNRVKLVGHSNLFEGVNKCTLLGTLDTANCLTTSIISYKGNIGKDLVEGLAGISSKRSKK